MQTLRDRLKKLVKAQAAALSRDSAGEKELLKQSAPVLSALLYVTRAYREGHLADTRRH